MLCICIQSGLYENSRLFFHHYLNLALSEDTILIIQPFLVCKKLVILHNIRMQCIYSPIFILSFVFLFLQVKIRFNFASKSFFHCCVYFSYQRNVLQMLLHTVTVEKRKQRFRLRERSNREISHYRKLFNYIQLLNGHLE